MLKRTQAALRQDDSAARVRRQRVRDQQWLDDVAAHSGRLPGRRRVLFFSVQQVPPWLEVEYSLAAALRLRGHHVRGIICDGLLPLCEMNLGRTDRPPCAVCTGWLARFEDAFGFEFSRLTQFISGVDRDAAEQRVADTPDEELSTLAVDQVDVGRLAGRELQRYARGFVFEPAADPAYRRWLVSATLLVRAAGRLLDHERPDIVVTSSGRTLPSACLCAAAKQRAIRVVTWDTEPTFADGLVFSHDQAAAVIPLDEAWSEVGHQPLTEDQRFELRAFAQRWMRSDNTPFPYNPDPIEDRESIRARLGLRPGAPAIVAFANSVWDLAVVDRDVGFAGMFEWLFALTEFAVAHPEMDLVVRAHPAETNVSPDLRSRTPVGPEILKRYGPLPSNIVLVDGASRVSSYVLADMARIVTAYASRIGLEIALRGKRPWIAGDATYRGKGFTRDLGSKEEMLGLLDAGASDDVLPADEIARAERFAYLWFFRYVARVPLLRPPDGRFRLKTFQDLAPGRIPALDRICDALVAGTPFLDCAG